MATTPRRCWVGGVRCWHSLLGGMNWIEITPRWVAQASHRMNRKYSIETKDTMDPWVDKAFHIVKVSG